MPCQASKNGSSVECTTDQLNALNCRLMHAMNDCLLLTERVGLYSCRYQAHIAE